ncbi:MAG TPA: glycoside hydrolase family 15 protein [Terracidiphilus sp.]|jgi:glucoamylase|nr:glycoside hydrolase family 15 protein [Terracidiphilus sp.]
MSNQPLYRWLEQQGEAFGSPGMPPRWTSSVKDAVGTAYSASSRLWFTCSHGIVNEIYHPTIDHAQVRDMEFLVTDGETFLHEEKRDLLSTFEYIHPEALGVRYINRDPDGRYSLTKEIICDPHHSVLLTRVRLEADKDLLARLKVYALLAPHLDGGGAGNSARAVDVAGYRMLLAWKDQWSLAMGASCGFSRVSCGFVGSSDGWRDLKDNFRMDWEFGSAINGNLAVMGELNLGCSRNGGVPADESSSSGRANGANGAQDAREFTVAIGIGDTQHTALQKTTSALIMPYQQHRTRFIEQWHRAANPEWLAVKAGDGGKLMRASHNVLLAHEDKTYSGAFVASASIPWGQHKSDDDLGGYHLVWTRDMVHTAGALLACGRAETARRALVYLACTQEPDGGFAQNFWVDGRPYWSGVQLDEVAFPIVLAWRLWKAESLGEMDIYPFVERAAGFLACHAPITHQERWEENAGYSPSTLAAVICGLICAAEIIRERNTDGLATFLEEFADWIEGHLEHWTVTNNGVLHPDVKRHYMRIRPPEAGEAYYCESCGKEMIRIANRPPGTRFEFEAREVVDPGFLELVRYGVRPADDPLIVDSLKVIDAVLKRDLPQGPGWLRYNWDGYGDRADGGPFLGWGQGRVWPLLTGERAHYELAAGRDITALIKTYEKFATPGQMMPEQVWDEPNRPGLGFRIGQPAGSAVPLVWAHAEYLKLLRSALDGRVFDRVDPVYERYCEAAGRERVRQKLEIYSHRRPIQKVTAGGTLRILDQDRFELVWSMDGWKSTHRTPSLERGSSGFSADVEIPVNAQAGELSWTLQWTEKGRWLGYNVQVKIDSE